MSANHLLPIIPPFSSEPLPPKRVTYAHALFKLKTSFSKTPRKSEVPHASIAAYHGVPHDIFWLHCYVYPQVLNRESTQPPQVRKENLHCKAPQGRQATTSISLPPLRMQKHRLHYHGKKKTNQKTKEAQKKGFDPSLSYLRTLQYTKIFPRLRPSKPVLIHGKIPFILWRRRRACK